MEYIDRMNCSSHVHPGQIQGLRQLIGIQGGRMGIFSLPVSS